MPLFKIEVGNGSFGPPPRQPDFTNSDLQILVAEALSELSALKPEAVNALVGCDVVLKSEELDADIQSREFLNAFSLPKFYFTLRQPTISFGTTASH